MLLLIVNMCKSPVALDNCKKVALQLNLHFLNNVVNLSEHNMLCYRVCGSCDIHMTKLPNKVGTEH